MAIDVSLQTLRRYLCNRTTEVTEAGVIFEEIPHMPEYFCPVTRDDLPTTGIRITEKWISKGIFTKIDHVHVADSRWAALYRRLIESNYVEVVKQIDSLSNALTAAHQQKHRLAQFKNDINRR